MMERIKKAFAKPAFVAYMVAGDPDTERSKIVASALVDGGADIIEVGIPFTDPVADGPVIQAADGRALSLGAVPSTAFEIAGHIRSISEAAIVIFTYINPIIRMGFDRFYAEAKANGADAVLIVDMPVEESDEALSAAEKHGLAQIFLVSITTSEERMKKIAGKAKGFAYLISTLGTTGQRDKIPDEALDLIARAKKTFDIPVVVGFGISGPENAKKMIDAGADGVVVGSAIVAAVGENLESDDGIYESVKGLAGRIRSGIVH
ncbi:tryptophan synthase subunit alpha [Methanolacinia petrolearia]|uniref:tryptophan synthase subunit alpha n=1 Tax=Methanolacinia petrolearia TaxID=54120 RepID=UPI003BA86F2B